MFKSKIFWCSWAQVLWRCWLNSSNRIWYLHLLPKIINVCFNDNVTVAWSMQYYQEEDEILIGTRVFITWSLTNRLIVTMHGCWFLYKQQVPQTSIACMYTSKCIFYHYNTTLCNRHKSLQIIQFYFNLLRYNCVNTLGQTYRIVPCKGEI